MEELNEKINKFGDRAMEDFKSEEVTALTPQRVDNYLMFFSGWYANLSDQISILEQREATEWPELRKECKTNTETDRLWKATEAGLEQISLKHKLKALEKLIAACKLRLKRLENESYNKY